MAGQHHAPPSLSREGVVVGPCLAITLYGLAAIFASAVLGEEIIPHSTNLTVVLLAAIMVVGAVVGTMIDARRYPDAR